MIHLSENPDLQYELTPNFEGRAWRTDVKINSDGFRGNEFTRMDPSSYRILVLGDSVAFGISLPVEASFPYRTEELIRKEFPRFEVRNLSVVGYNTFQEVTLLERKGLEYHPNLVVIGYCLNDPMTFAFDLIYLRRLQEYSNNFLFRSRLMLFVARRLDRAHLTTFLQDQNDPGIFSRVYRNRIDPIGPEEKFLRRLIRSSENTFPAVYYSHEAHVGLIRYAFRRLSELSVKNRFKVVIVIIPALEQRDGKYPYRNQHRIVQYEASRFNFDILDTTDQFMKYGMDRLRMLRSDKIHPNEEGHRILAETLASYIRTLPWKEKRPH